MKQNYTGGCQCGKVRYEASFELGEVLACNCSRCGKLGSLLAFLPAGDFSLKSGGEQLTTYNFNKHVIDHKFCSACGIESFAAGKMPDGTEMIAINARCLDGVDVGSLKVKHIDGARM